MKLLNLLILALSLAGCKEVNNLSDPPRTRLVTRLIEHNGKTIVEHNGEPLFFSGIQYWGLDKWNLGNWDADIENFKKLGLNGVRLNIAWDHIEPFEDEFDFSQLKVLINKLDRANIKVYLQFNQSAHSWRPAWFEEKIDTEKLSVRAIKENGKKASRYSFGSDLFKQKYSNYVIRTINEVKGFNNIVAYSVFSEPHYSPKSKHWLDYNPENIEKFRSWLTQKYSSVSDLNLAWHKAYAYFSQAEPFHKELPPDSKDLPENERQWFLDWRKYNAVAKARFIGGIISEARQHDPDHLYGQNMMWKWSDGNQAQVALDPEINYEYADIIGINVYPGKSKHSKAKEAVSFIRTLHNNKKAVWLGEFNQKRGKASEKDLELMILPAIDAGLSGFIYFTYRAFTLNNGKDRGHYGVVCENNTFKSTRCSPQSFEHLQNFMANSIVGKESLLLNTVPAPLTGYYLWPQATQYLTYGDKGYSFRAYRNFLSKTGPGLQVLSESQFLEGDFDHQTPLYVPSTPFRSEAVAEALLNWQEKHEVNYIGEQDYAGEIID